MADIESSLTLLDPVNELVTTDEFKEHVHEDLSDSGNDDVIDAMIDAATKWAERYVGLRFMPGVCVYTLNKFPEGKIILPRPIIQNMTSFTYLNTGGTSSSLTQTTDYTLKAALGELVPAYGKSWPAHRESQSSVQITYDSGFSASSAAAVNQRDSVPNDIKLAVKMLAAHWYEFRVMGDIPNGVKMLLYPHRMKEFS